MGKALAEGKRRDKVFLMTKVCGRTAKDAQSNLEDSLRRLKTDHLDLWQFHEIVYDNDPDWIFAEDGAIHTGLKALKEGKVRYLGFTGHKDPHDPPQDARQALRVGDRADAPERDGRPLPELPEAGPARSWSSATSACIGMKSLGGNGSIVTKAGVPVEDALALRPLAADLDARLGHRLGEGARPEPQDRPRLQADERRRAARHREPRRSGVAGDGRFELFKSSKVFDGPVHRKQHGFDTDIKAV